MNARTLTGLASQISVPTDVAEYLRAARVDLSGTDYPGALELLKALTDKLVSQHASPRGIRTFHARYILALEGYDDEAAANIDYLLDVLSNYDLKA